MKELYSNIFLTIVSLFFVFCVNAQSTTISGNVKNNISKENVAAVSVILKGTSAGTFTDNNGNFKISGNYTFPVTLVFSSIGFEEKEAVVSSGRQVVQVALTPSYALGSEVIVASSRLPERILESPVTIERVSAATIRNAAASSYYDLLANLKGVDMVASSLNFKTPSTRGFNSSGNLRLNQMIEGMDNQSPGLNFSVGAMAGLTELDVESMELLSGASSAL